MLCKLDCHWSDLSQHCLFRAGKRKDLLEGIFQDAPPVEDSYYYDSRMGSIPALSVAAAFILVTIACSFTYVGAGTCAPIRCDNGTTKSPRCRAGDDMDVCFGPLTPVSFGKTFTQAPAVHFGLGRVDMLKLVPQRTGADLLDVTATGFNIKWSCEKPTFCYGVDINWIACGP